MADQIRSPRDAGKCLSRYNIGSLLGPTVGSSSARQGYAAGFQAKLSGVAAPHASILVAARNSRYSPLNQRLPIALCFFTFQRAIPHLRWNPANLYLY